MPHNRLLQLFVVVINVKLFSVRKVFSKYSKE